MTLQQQAYGLIDTLSDESILALIQVMKKMLPYDRQRAAGASSQSPAPDPVKMNAFLRMQELRKISASYDLSEDQRAAALDEKYGKLNGSEKTGESAD